MPEEKGTAVAKRSEQLALIHKAILGNAELPPVDPEAMSRAIMERILAAESFEEAFTPQSLTPWRSMLGVPFFVRDVHFNRSSYEGGSTVYAVCDLQHAGDGGNVTATCGGRNVLIQLVKALQEGWLEDRAVKMVENKTSEGFGALWLEAA